MAPKKNMSKVIYEESYKKGHAQIRKDKLPWLSHTAKGFVVDEAHVMKAGKMDDGREYQVIKVFLKEEASS